MLSMEIISQTIRDSFRVVGFCDYQADNIFNARASMDLIFFCTM